MKTLILTRKTVLLWLMNTLLLSLVSACQPRPEIPKLDIPGVSLLATPSHGHIMDAAWSPDSQSMLVLNLDDDRGPRNSMRLLDTETGKTTQLLESMKLLNVRDPYFSPDGGRAMFNASSSPVGSGIHELDLQTGELKVRFDTLYATWSTSQDIVALLNASECEVTVPRRYWVCLLNTATGEQKVIHSTTQIFHFGGMDWSPNGRQLIIAFKETDPDTNEPDQRRLYLYDLQSGQFSPVTPDSVDSYDPAWSPDGKYIAYIQTDLIASEAQLMVMRADGSCPTPLIPIPVTGLVESPAWSPDGNWLSFVYWFNLYKVDLDDEAVKRTLANCP